MKNYVDFVDVGHGNCTLIVGQSTTTLIDAGPKPRLLEYLRSEEITSIDTIIISHADLDHIGGLIGIISSKKVKVRKIFVNSDGVKDTDSWNDLTWELASAEENKDIELIVGCKEGKEIKPEHDLEFKVVAPSALLALRGIGGKVDNKAIRSNSLSIAIKLIYKGKSVALFTGDMDSMELKEIQRTGVDVKAAVLQFPHHGGLSGGNHKEFSENLLEMVQPEAVIFSFGREKLANPNPASVKAVKAYGKARTICTQLSKHCSKHLPIDAPTHLANIYANGVSTGACCGGTVRLLLANLEVKPVAEKHAAFIKSNATTALCR